MKHNKSKSDGQEMKRRVTSRSVSTNDCRLFDDEIPPDQWAIDTVLDRLKMWRSSGDGFAVRCPAHADWNPSLSINETADGSVLIKCHAGCLTEEILEVLGLKYAHLYTSEYARRFGRRKCQHPARSVGYRLPTEVAIDREKFAKILTDSRIDDDDEYMPLCRATGLCVQACIEFGLGVRGSRFVFPERDDQLLPVGVVYRWLNGKKSCHPNSIRGLTIPIVNREFKGPLYVAEGATDAMALHQSRVRAIGRPTAFASTPVHNWLVAYLTRHAVEGVVILGDNDPGQDNGRRTGRDAARDLAKRLVGVLPDYVPVSWALPQKAYKDVREQVIAGAWNAGLERKVVQG